MAIRPTSLIMREKSALLLCFSFVCLLAFCSGGQESNENGLKPCGKYKWTCYDGQCISEYRHCDRHPDCDDGSDEKDCRNKYCNSKTHHFCQSGECIDQNELCDGGRDCANGEDEEVCHTNSCPVGEKLCDDQCISSSLKCQKSLCSKEESGCEKTCPEGYAPCSDGKCIPSHMFCNQNPDCATGEDEEQCAVVENCGDNGSFLCLNHERCIKKDWVCDRFPHCTDKSDEGGLCDETCKQSKTLCQQGCQQTPGGSKCYCRDGYEINRDNRTCQDIDECSGDLLVCDHFCRNTPGSFVCSCAEKYHLEEGVNCRIKKSAMLLFTIGNSIKAKFLDQSGSLVIWRGEVETRGVTYDPKEEAVYWLSGNEVLYKKLKQDSPKVLLNKGLGNAENLAIDWVRRNLYISNYKDGFILICSLETKSCLPILKNLPNPRSLQIDIENGHLYWAEIKSREIKRSNLDGSNKLAIVKRLGIPNGLAVDQPASRIYWIDAGHDIVASADFNGRNRTQFKGDGHAYSLAVWQDKIYWTEWQSGLRKKIYSAQKRNGDKWRVEYSDKRSVGNLAISHESLYKSVDNPCDRYPSCSDICLSTEGKQNCLCPQETRISNDGLNCIETGDNPLIFVNSKLYSVHLRKYGKSTLTLMNLPSADIGRVTDMDYNPITDEIVFTDSEKLKVFILNLAQNSYKTINGIVKPIAVAIDWLRGNLYWINGFHESIDVAQISGQHRLTIIKSMVQPTDLALDVLEGLIYVSNAGSSPSILRCRIDGTGCGEILGTEVENPKSISLDLTKQKRIYWVEKTKIKSANLLGNDSRVELADLKKPIKLLVNEKHLMWTEKHSLSLNVVLKSSLREWEEITIDSIHSEWTNALTMKEKVEGSRLNICQDKCAHFCFSTKERKTCGCGQGYALADDGSSCKKEVCRAHELECSDGECIPASFWCDGSTDCADESDEVCHLEKCLEDEFKCKNGKCIVSTETCDGANDCGDSSDEQESHCKKECRKNEEWQCDSGECIPRIWRCNGHQSCNDGSDEKNCGNDTCTASEIRCNHGQCIPKYWKCDGSRDCPEGEDEQSCPCKLGEYRCKNGLCIYIRKLCLKEISCESEEANLTCPYNLHALHLNMVCPANQIPCHHDTTLTLQCIPHNAWCNGTEECEGGNDERECASLCRTNEVMCKDEKQCIEKSWRCDGVEDCQGGSDERGCGEEPKIAGTSQGRDGCGKDFSCSEGDCVPVKSLCDGVPDCDNGFDETDNCGKCLVDNGGCQHTCNNHPVQTVCSCNKGYELATDGYSCWDLNECKLDNPCDHNCKNTEGHYLCSCIEGYTLTADGVSCKPTDGTPWRVGAFSKRLFFYLDENIDVEEEMSLPLSAKQIWYDPITKVLIALDDKGYLFKLTPTSSWRNGKLNSNVVAAPDFLNRNVYFTEVITRRNKRSYANRFVGSDLKLYNLDTKLSGHLIHIPKKKISSLVVFASLGKLLTCENNDYKGAIILRNLDGTYSRDLVTLKIRMCGNLVVDEVRKRVYWIDGYLDRIYGVDASGLQRQRYFAGEVNGATSLALLNDHLIWVNSKQLSVVKCSTKSSSCSERAYNTSLSLFSISPVFDLSVPTPCSSNHCEQLCIPLSFGHVKCICASGYTPDRERCIKDKSIGAESVKCDESTCLNGRCTQLSGAMYCKCETGYKGKFCEVYVGSSGSAKTTILVIVIIILILASGFCLVYFCKKYPSKLWSRTSPLVTFRFMTSNFELMKDYERTDGSSPPPSSLARSSRSAAAKVPIAPRGNLSIPEDSLA